MVTSSRNFLEKFDVVGDDIGVGAVLWRVFASVLAEAVVTKNQGRKNNVY